MKRVLFIVFALACGDKLLADTSEGIDYDPETPEGADWSCLGQEPVMARRQPGRVQYVASVVDFESGAAVPGLETQVCANPGCSEELLLCTGELGDCYALSGGVAGHELVFDFPFGFDGNLRFRALGYIDLIYVLGGPMVGTTDGELTVTGSPLPMLSIDAVQSVYGAVGAQIFDPTRGILMLRALDCTDRLAAGVRVEPLAGTVVNASSAFSLSNQNIPTPDSWVTDSRGIIGFANLAPDAQTVAAIAPTGEQYARAIALVRSGSLTIAELRSGIGAWGR